MSCIVVFIVCFKVIYLVVYNSLWEVGGLRLLMVFGEFGVKFLFGFGLFYLGVWVNKFNLVWGLFGCGKCKERFGLCLISLVMGELVIRDYVDC